MKAIKLKIEYNDPFVIVYAGKLEIDHLAIYDELTSMLTPTGKFIVIEDIKEESSVCLEDQKELKENQAYQLVTYSENHLYTGTKRQCIKYAQKYLYAKYALEEDTIE